MHRKRVMVQKSTAMKILVDKCVPLSDRFLSVAFWALKCLFVLTARSGLESLITQLVVSLSRLDQLVALASAREVK